MPFYPEFAVNKIFSQLKDHAILKLYLPDLSEGSYPERAHFYTIVATLFPKGLDEIIKKARENRALNQNNDKDELIKMTPEVYQEIKELLSHSSKFSCK